MTRLDFAPDADTDEILAAVRSLVALAGGWSPELPAGAAAAMEAEIVLGLLPPPSVP